METNKKIVSGSVVKFDYQPNQKIKTNKSKLTKVREHQRKRYMFIYKGVCGNCQELCQLPDSDRLDGTERA